MKRELYLPRVSKNVIISFLLLGWAISSAAADTFTDNFDLLNTDLWGCEFACPDVSDGIATFTLEPGAVNTNTTWSKLSYKANMFVYGTWSMTFSPSSTKKNNFGWKSAELIKTGHFLCESACSV